ncbi:MAG: neutral/alkaline non-lysosomal ceramidase N-terminal domain-containing protein [Planctomycetota bacterium]|nr:neutral/alkaline non-lysosomal ceramidase N-terminal domain-containing protein [Planctomycetota bacterium]MDA1138565.1 neutral/alkaline non-lysosomal ceramidase N-terminal domain-containing protein [Planctomycetota bacterium]
MKVNAAAAKVDITPPIGLWMTGFGARDSAATGIHDPLYAKALVIESASNRVVLVCLDIIQPSPDIMAQVRFGVEQTTGIPAESLFINSTHTHSGPTTFRFNGMGVYDVTYCDQLSRKIVSAVQMACNDLAPATLSYGSSPVAIGANRRLLREDGGVSMRPNDTGSYDPTVYVLRIKFEDRAPALLMTHAAHPVILGSDNLEFSADFCGFACSAVEENLGEGSIALFMQGCCGDINADRGDGSFEQAAMVGKKLATAVLDSSTEALAGGGISGSVETVQLPLIVPSIECCEQELCTLNSKLEEAVDSRIPWKIRNAEAMVNWARRVNACALNGNFDRTQSMQIHGLRIGNLAFLGTEAETFVDYAFSIQEQSPIPKTVVAGYTNGCIGYLPTARAYPEGGYEVDTAIRYYGLLMMKPESEELVVRRSLDLLDRLG